MFLTNIEQLNIMVTAVCSKSRAGVILTHIVRSFIRSL
jgi:hypothetical protein